MKSDPNRPTHPAGREGTQDTLHQREAYLSSLLNALADAVFTVHMPQRRIAYANRAVTSIFGYIPDELIGQTTEKLYTSATGFAGYGHRLHDALARGQDSISAELELRHKDGHTIYADVKTTFLLRGGQPATVVSVVRVITQRRRAEEAVRANDQFYRDLVENSQDLIYTHDADGTLLSVNAAAIRSTGYSRDALLQMNLVDLLTQGARSSFAAYLAELQSKRAANGLVRIRTEDGKSRWWEYDTNLRTEGVAEPVVHGVARDVTEREIALRALRASEDKFSKAFHVNPDAININRVEDGQYVAINRGFTLIMGYAEDEVIGHRSIAIDIWDDPNDRARLVEGLRKDGTVANLEARFRAKDGSIRVGLMSASVIQIDGVPHIISVTRDVTAHKRTIEALSTRTMVLTATLENMAQGISVVDADLRLLALNNRFLALLDFPTELLREGVTLEEVLRFNALRGEYGPGDPEELVRTRMALARRFEPHVFERVRANGTVLEIRGTPMPGGGFVTTYTDITERKRSELALRDGAEAIRVFADNVPAMTASLDKNLRYRFVNKRFAEFFGGTPEDILGKQLREVIGEQAYQDVKADFAQAMQGFPTTYYRTLKLPNSEPRYLEVKVLPHLGEQGAVLGCFTVTTDITEHKLAEERIQLVAHHDSLTGLPNRLLFNDRLQQTINLAKRDSRQFALLYLDLDRFKRVNDSLGHAAGDELLQAVAARMRCEVRESDTVARIGGDEFAVILPDIAKGEEAGTVAGKIIAAVAEPFNIGSQNHRANIGTSIGIAIYPGDGGDADALAGAADTAMYRAKQAGSGFLYFNA